MVSARQNEGHLAGFQMLVQSVCQFDLHAVFERNNFEATVGCG